MASIADILSSVENELHIARHEVASFPVDENPLLDMGWQVGFLFGIHFAHQYPKMSFNIERDVWSMPDKPSSKESVDRVAQKLAETVYAPTPLSLEKQVELWAKMAEKMKETPVETTQEMWPLPKVWNGWEWTQ